MPFEFLLSPLFWIPVAVGVLILARLGMLDSILGPFMRKDDRGGYKLPMMHELYVKGPNGTFQIDRLGPDFIGIAGEKEVRPGFILNENLIPEDEETLITGKGILYTNLGLDHMTYDNHPGTGQIRKIMRDNSILAMVKAQQQRTIAGLIRDKDFKSSEQKMNEAVENLASVKDAAMPMMMSKEMRKKIEQMGGGIDGRQ